MYYVYYVLWPLCKSGHSPVLFHLGFSLASPFTLQIELEISAETRDTRNLWQVGQIELQW